MSFAWLYLYLLPFLVVLTVVVFVHEFGHYYIARRNGVKVEVFSIGFGPEIFGFNDSHGTRWKFSMIPLGGYVRMFSDVDASSRPDQEMLKKLTPEEKAVSHHYKSPWQRFQIAAAGPVANYIFGILLLSLVYALHGQRVPTEEPLIGYVVSGGVAETSGLKAGDRVVSIDNHQVTSFANLRDFIRGHPDVALEVNVERDGQPVKVSLTPKSVKEVSEDGKVVQAGQIGIVPAIVTVKRGPIEAIGYGFYDAYTLTVQTLASIGRMIIRTQSTEGLTGPIGIAKQTGDIATTDVPTFFWFIAFLSINLGFVNLLPVPVLDGGTLLFCFIEGVRGRPLSERTQENAFRVGLLLILTLILFTTYKDVENINLFGKILSIFN